MTIHDTIDARYKELGIHQFAFLKTTDLRFSDGVRQLCKENSCGQYGRTWACPPGVGPLEECKRQLLSYENLFVFTTVHPLEDSFDVEGMAAGKERHAQVRPQVVRLFEEQYGNILVLSTGGCQLCASCTYPDAPCRFPKKLQPSLSSYGVEVNRLAARAGINYINGVNTVTYFTCILYS